jgi:hypothetical protein
MMSSTSEVRGEVKVSLLSEAAEFEVRTLKEEEQDSDCAGAALSSPVPRNSAKEAR